MKTNNILIVLLLCLSTIPVPANADFMLDLCKTSSRNDGPDAITDAVSEVACYLNSDDVRGYDALARLAQEWESPSQRFLDGRPKIIGLGAGFHHAFTYRERDWSKSLERVRTLRKRFPNTGFAAVAEAGYWSAYAWNVRGYGYSHSVTDDGWKLFRERLETAESILLESKPYASSFPSWYDQMISVQMGLGRSPEMQYKTFVEGSTRFKTYFPIYFSMTEALTPKWGGSWDAVDKFVTRSVNNTKETEGQTMYARIYWYAAKDVSAGKSLFSETRAKWPKMKLGFEDIMARYPDSKWNLNNFASFACMAGDKITFLKLRKKIGDATMEPAWPSNRSIEFCDQKFGYAK